MRYKFSVMFLRVNSKFALITVRVSPLDFVFEYLAFLVVWVSSFQISWCVI